MLISRLKRIIDQQESTTTTTTTKKPLTQTDHVRFDRLKFFIVNSTFAFSPLSSIIQPLEQLLYTSAGHAIQWRSQNQGLDGEEKEKRERKIETEREKDI